MDDNILLQTQSNSLPNAPIQEPAPAVKPNDDISRTTIAVLVVLTLMISIIGTWTVLNEISAVKITNPSGPATSVGRVQLTINNPNGPSKAMADTTGKVTLQIERLSS